MRDGIFEEGKPLESIGVELGFWSANLVFNWIL